MPPCDDHNGECMHTTYQQLVWFFFVCFSQFSYLKSSNCARTIVYGQHTSQAVRGNVTYECLLCDTAAAAASATATLPCGRHEINHYTLGAPAGLPNFINKYH